MWVIKGTDGGKRHLLNRWEGVFPKNISQQYLLFYVFLQCHLVICLFILPSNLGWTVIYLEQSNVTKMTPRNFWGWALRNLPLTSSPLGAQPLCCEKLKPCGEAQVEESWGPPSTGPTGFRMTCSTTPLPHELAISMLPCSRIPARLWPQPVPPRAEE